MTSSRALTRSVSRSSQVRYTLDALHRLRVATRQTTGKGHGSVRVLTGRFEADAANRLVFHPDRAAPDRAVDPQEPAPETVALEGKWSLRSDRWLTLSMRGASGARQALRLAVQLLSANASSVSFALDRTDASGNRVTEELKLAGRWQADASNRLTFWVSRANGAEDRLTFQAAWETGPNHELIYRWRAVSGPRPTEAQWVRFAGAWEAPVVGHLIYRLEGSTDSVFDFRAGVGSPSLRASDGRISWQVGVGLSRYRTVWTRVALFGAWKISKDGSLEFEVPYADGQVRGIRFEGRYAWGGRNTVTVELADSRRRPFGIALTLTRELSSTALVFLTVRKDGSETSAMAGVQVKF